MSRRTSCLREGALLLMPKTNPIYLALEIMALVSGGKLSNAVCCDFSCFLVGTYRTRSEILQLSDLII